MLGAIGLVDNRSVVRQRLEAEVGKVKAQVNTLKDTVQQEVSCSFHHATPSCTPTPINALKDMVQGGRAAR